MMMSGSLEPSGRIVIYQMLPRLFGNKKRTNRPYGTLEENGVGKFNDITETALLRLEELGVTHVWYTGIIEHATMTDYSIHGIEKDDPDVVKGRAGSPYAIKDYYEVDPDLAVDVGNRMGEFESLIERTHRNGLKVIIDFVPNHVARRYASDAKPPGLEDLGVSDDTSKAFDPNNNFYYLPGRRFVVPNPEAPDRPPIPGMDGFFDEFPAKVSGNDVFSEKPSVCDWYETVKLNYGVDILNGRKSYFDPIPSTWIKMRDILVFWTGKQIDGFRCDMAEMVPVEFWNWVIPQIKRQNPNAIFIAEIYNPEAYHSYVNAGRFDYLYDKVGVYDRVRDLMTGSAEGLTGALEHSKGIEDRMLRFLENHDEQRIASPHFAGNPWAAVPGMTISATLSGGPVMICCGQEVGESGAGSEGFQGDDGRTTIFDYWGMPEHQKWINGGRFDGGLLSEGQKRLRAFYQRLFQLCRREKALVKGSLQLLDTGNAKTYGFLRFVDNEKLLVLANFDRNAMANLKIKIPGRLFESTSSLSNQVEFTDLLFNQERISSNPKGLEVRLPPLGARIYRIAERVT